MTVISKTIDGVGRLEWANDEEIANYTLMLREPAPGVVGGHGSLTGISSGRLLSAFKAGKQELVAENGVRWPIVITLLAIHEADFILDLASELPM